MAIGSITSIVSATSSAGATQTAAITVPAGAAIVIGVSEFSTTTIGTLSDATNGAYTLATTKLNATAPSTVGIFYFLNSQALTAVILTYTKGTSGDNTAMSGISAPGVALTSALDTSVTAATTSGAANPPVINFTSGVATAAGELFCAIWGGETNGTVPTYTADTGNGWNSPPPFSIIQSIANSNAGAWIAGGYVIKGAAAANGWNPSIAAGNGNRVADAIIIGLKAAPSNSHLFALMGVGT